MSTTSRKLFKSSTSLVALLISSVVIGLFMMPFLVHSLGDEQYGIWILVGSIIAFYEIMDFGLSNAMQRFLIRAIHGEELEESNISLSNSIALTTVIAVIFMLVTSIIIFFTPNFTDSEANATTFQLTIAILGARAAIQFPLFPYYGVLLAHYRQDIIGYIQLISLYARTVLTIYFVVNGHGIITIAIISSLTQIAGSIAIVAYSKKLSPDIGFSFKYLKISKFSEYYHYGKYVFVIHISEKMKVSLDNSVVAAFVGLSAVTHYTIAVTLVQYFGNLLGSLFGVISPALHKYHKLNQWNNLREIFLVTTDVTTLASILVGGTLLTLGDQFIFLWIGEGYDDAYLALLILGISAILINTQQAVDPVLYAIAKHKYLAKITSIEALVNLSLSIILAQYIGIYGVALGTALPSLFNALFLRPRYACKQLGIPSSSYYRILGKGFILGLIVFFPGYYVSHTISTQSWTMLIFSGLLLSAIYAFLYSRFAMNSKTASYVIASVPQRLIPFVKLFTGTQNP